MKFFDEYRWKKIIFLCFFLNLIIFSCQASQPSIFSHFITASGDQLIEGDSAYYFISFNLPNLLSIEDNMLFMEVNPWRLPDSFEIRDALTTIRDMGGRVARTYTITVRRQGESESIPRHVLAPGQFNETAFQTMDQILAEANRIGVRLIIPLVDNWKWMGGKPQYAQFRGKAPEEFWTDEQLIADFKQTIFQVLNRKNTFTGQLYKDDLAVLAWELGNELRECPDSWTREMAAYIKSIDKNHLVADGVQNYNIQDHVPMNPYIDVVSTHHYENNPDEMVAHIRQAVAKTKGKKPYYIGEFGFVSTSGLQTVLEAVIIEKAISGALLWSLRFHNRDGGFYWHSEPHGGGLYKAYHWPGFPSGILYDEADVLTLLKEKAYAIQGKSTPAISKPETPRLLKVSEWGNISWQGSAGANLYQVERAETASGPWKTIGWDISDSWLAHGPLFTDGTAEPGQNYFYRIIAKNWSGFSDPSNSIGPVTVNHRMLVDEYLNLAKTYSHRENLQLKNDDTRKFKEDFHRISGEPGSWLIYRIEDPIISCRIFSFSADGKNILELSTSADGKNYLQILLSPTDFYRGDRDYEYWHPVLLEANLIGNQYHYLKIEFTDSGQIGRIEIIYGK